MYTSTFGVTSALFYLFWFRLQCHDFYTDESERKRERKIAEDFKLNFQIFALCLNWFRFVRAICEAFRIDHTTCTISGFINSLFDIYLCLLSKRWLSRQTIKKEENESMEHGEFLFRFVLHQTRINWRQIYRITQFLIHTVYGSSNHFFFLTLCGMLCRANDYRRDGFFCDFSSNCICGVCHFFLL